MEQKKNVPHPVMRRLLQGAIRKERQGWPPGSLSGIYQPRRPEAPLARFAAKAEK